MEKNEKYEVRTASPEVIFERLVELYKTNPLAVAIICDEVLDRTGRLLGEVRKGANGKG